MFETQDEIVPALTAAGLGDWADAIARRCAPAIAFEPAASDAAGAGDGAQTGNSRVGGLPDLPATLPWPARDAYPGWQQFVARSHHGPALGRGLRDDRPLWFLAQINLAQAARALPPGGAEQDRLPDHGRLLFFWDVNCGPWVESARSCRVIFDATPLAAIAPRAAPDDLAVDHFPSAFAAPPLAMLGIWSMPDRELLKALLQDGTFDAMVEDGDCDDLWDDIMDNGPSVLASGRAVLAHRLRGWPIPEQWDPRYTAALAARGIDIMQATPSAADRDAADIAMHDWTLLLQLDCTAFGFAEGIVCFVMRADELRRRDFSAVHAIFQQT